MDCGYAGTMLDVNSHFQLDGTAAANTNTKIYSKGLVLVAAFHRPFHMRVDGSMQGQNRTNGPSPGPRSEIVCEHFLTLS
jgi:hypothetical protein